MGWDSVWEKIFQESEWGKYPAESLIRFIANNFYHKRNGGIKILEVGCGPGANIWYLAREGFEVYGIDGSPTAIAKAKDRIADEGFNAQLKVGDIMTLPYDDCFFDAVIDVECLYCNDRKDTKAILGEISRCLKDDGLFYSRTLADDMYVGNTQTKVGHLEYKEISDGPIAGKGYARLIDKAEMSSLYGTFFTIRSIDKLEYTIDNGSMKVSEWIIVSQKRGKR